MTRLPPAHSIEVCAVAAWGVPGSLLELPREPLDESAFAQLLAAVKHQRLTGLLWHAVAEGDMVATAGQAERIEWQHVEALAGSLALERLLLETVDILEQRSVQVRVLKGTALAHLDYPDPSHRMFGDIDLLVPGSDFDRAVRTLGELGHRRLHPEPRPGFDRRYSKGTSFRTSDGMEIDLHRTFTMGPLGIRLDLESVWERSEKFRLGDTMLQALPAEERFVHACYHAALGEVVPRLVPLRDVAQLALAPGLNLERVHALLASSGGHAVAAKSVSLAWQWLQVADVLAISAWAESHRAGHRELAELAVYGEGSSYALKAWASLRALPTLRDRAAYLYALAVPTKSYVGGRHEGRIDRLRVGARQVRKPR